MLCQQAVGMICQQAIGKICQQAIGMICQQAIGKICQQAIGMTCQWAIGKRVVPLVNSYITPEEAATQVQCQGFNRVMELMVLTDGSICFHLCTVHVIGQVSKGHLGLYHPELC